MIHLRLRDPEAVKAELAALPPEQLAQVSPRWLERVRNARAPDPWIHGYTACGADGLQVLRFQKRRLAIVNDEARLSAGRRGAR